MSGIHDAILHKVQDELTAALITNIAVDDPAIAGVVKLGPLQGDPDPDVARISVELYENDPDQEITGSGIGHDRKIWEDEVEEIEVGCSVIWYRRFTVKARCLFDSTQENLSDARSIASTVRSRIEDTLLGIQFNGLAAGNEFVSRGCVSQNIRGGMVQLGGPPNSYDYQIKVKFDILTTNVIRG